jgi:hypothetical protein
VEGVADSQKQGRNNRAVLNKLKTPHQIRHSSVQAGGGYLQRDNSNLALAALNV